MELRWIMGRQINYYMELDSYKLLVKKAFDLGFKAIERDRDFTICNNFDELTFLKQGMYLYLEEAGELIINENGYIDTLRSSLVESGFSFMNEKKKEISSSRLWVSTGYWNDSGEFIKRDDILDKKYSMLAKYAKKLAPYTEIEVKARNPMYDGKRFIRKEYITPFLLEKIKSGDYDCV